MKTYKVLSALLDYPSEELVEALPELREALDQEDALPRVTRDAVERLLRELETDDLLELQERYVSLFDRVRSLSLHLFEHVHGDSRDRGQALVDLRQLYERNGFLLSSTELPDCLPVFLEFLSRVDRTDAAGLLCETSGILEGIRARLTKRGSAYAGVFQALLSLSGRKVTAASLVSDEDIRREDDPATLDAQWEEQPAFGSMPACGVAKRQEVSVIQVHRRSA
jgi:nitrate reductase delta subunit